MGRLITGAEGRPVAAVVLLLAAAIATPALATNARVAALGGGADYLVDERSALRWYATGVDVGDLAVFDLGRFDTGGGGKAWSDRIGGQAGGLHLRLDRDGTWGTALAHFHSEAVQAAPSQVHADYPGGSFSLGWARGFGSWDLGLGFRGTTYAEAVGDDESLTVAREDYRHDWGLGLRWRFSERGALELAGEIRNALFRLVDDGRQIDEPGQNTNGSYGLRVRAGIATTQGVVFVPLLDYTRDLQTIYSLQLADVAGLNARLFRAGIGCRYAPEDGENLVVSCEYRDGREAHDSHGGLYRAYDAYRRDWWSLLVRAGIEGDVRNWLTVRLSLQYRRVDDEAISTWSAGDDPGRNRLDARRVVDVPLGIGVAVHAGRLRVDASYNDTSPLSTTNVPDANAPREAANFAIVSVRYDY